MIAVPPLCTYAELTDGTYNISELADMHEALDLRAEIDRRRAAALAAAQAGV